MGTVDESGREGCRAIFQRHLVGRCKGGQSPRHEGAWLSRKEPRAGAGEQGKLGEASPQFDFYSEWRCLSRGVKWRGTASIGEVKAVGGDKGVQVQMHWEARQQVDWGWMRGRGGVKRLKARVRTRMKGDAKRRWTWRRRPEAAHFLRYMQLVYIYISGKAHRDRRVQSRQEGWAPVLRWLHSSCTRWKVSHILSK
jgi:hypothetical protein